MTTTSASPPVWAVDVTVSSHDHLKRGSRVQVQRSGELLPSSYDPTEMEIAMPFYPDWIVALDDVSKDKPGATITPRNAQDIIDELTRLKRQVKAFVTPEADRTAADRLTVSVTELSMLTRS